MNQDFPKVEMTLKRWVIAAVAAAIGLWALLDNGLTGLISVGLLGLLVLASLRLGRSGRGKGWNRTAPFNPPGAGPTDDEWIHDATYNFYAGNSFHRFFHKDS